MRARARPSTPPSTSRLPYNNSPAVGHFMVPRRCPHCKDIPDNIFSLPPYSVDDPDPPPHYEDLFPPGYTPFPDLDTVTQSIPMTRQPILFVPLDPPPPYDSLLPQQCLQTLLRPPKFPRLLEQPLFLGYRCWVRLGLVVPVHPPYLNFYITFF